VTADSIYLVEITWVNGHPTRHLVDREQLGDISFAEWHDNLVARANTRPQWAKLGDLSFHTQGVRSVELIETIEKED
jgi:hypothetical protein